MPQLSSNRNILVLIGLVVLIACGVFFYFISSQKVPENIPVVEEVKKVTKTSEVIGTSVDGRSITAYHYGDGTKRITFVGGIHGGYEWNGVLLAYTLMDYLDANLDSIPKNLTISIIPNANPDAVYKVTGKEGRFAVADVTKDTKTLESARFNTHGVDLNRNFDCTWQPKSTWRSKAVSAGTEVFSEPEAKAIRSFMLKYHPEAVIFWHSQADAVYASQCEKGILSDTLTLMNTYADASGYKAVKIFDAYPITGAADDWLAKIGIPAITVELKTHESIEWEKNLKGIQAVLTHYSK